MGNENIIKPYRYDHHPDLIVSLNEDELNFKSEVDEKVETGMGMSQEYNEPSLEQWFESNDCHQYEGNNKTQLVTVRCLPTYSNIKGVDFEVKRESDTGQEYLEFNQSYNQNIKGTNGNDSVPVEYVQVNHKMEDEVDFKVEIEENVKIEIDSYQKVSEVPLEQQFIKEEENIDSTLIQRHQRENEIMLMFQCSICRKQNSSTARLKSHMLLHLKEAENTSELLSSKICDNLGLENKILAKIKGKEYHLNVFKCGECEHIASNKVNLMYHLKRKHLNSTMNNEVGLTCMNLKEHKFKCNLCDIKTNNKSNLHSHLRSVHLKEGKFVCHLCEYKGSQKSHLYRHLSSVHLKERKLQCHLCEYKSNQKTHLESHVSSVHLKERKLHCNFCEYKTNLKCNLNRHLSSIHFKEKKLQCYLCEYKANQKSHMDRHMRSSHLTR